MTRLRAGRLAPVLLFVLMASALGAACSGGPDAGPVEIRGVTVLPPARHRVEVTGLSSAELDALARAGFDERAWQAILRITVADNDSTAVAGIYEITDTALHFVPRFPFDAGRTYAARFDPARLPAPRSEAIVSARIRFSGPEATPSTAVAAVYPSGEVWPENMLRFYVHFSAPMSRTNGVRFIHLIDDRGREVEDAILAAYADLWNSEATRLTVFFDPGRVKRGVGPNVELGRAIVEGRRYAVAIDAEWPDANGQPLVAAFRREFTAGPPAYDALALKDWRITAPSSGSTRPLAVTFPAALDHALLGRAIAVKTADGLEVAGRPSTGAAETVWTFTPASPWASGAYQLAVLTLLEDPAGNRVGQPFEVLPETPAPDRPGDIETLPFQIQ